MAPGSNAVFVECRKLGKSSCRRKIDPAERELREFDCSPAALPDGSAIDVRLSFQAKLCQGPWIVGANLKQFQEKCVAVFRPELRENKELERFRVSVENESAPGVSLSSASLP
ncbi:hypothetical protein ACFWXH_15120 [Mesorhizobium sp. NPDC059054]|uniref:hypothetical protein n=1 Tax=Mesorhizobium sp. NPDC059054 TaxID=3346711 RepID=UPI00368C1128